MSANIPVGYKLTEVGVIPVGAELLDGIETIFTHLTQSHKKVEVTAS